MDNLNSYAQYTPIPRVLICLLNSKEFSLVFLFRIKREAAVVLSAAPNTATLGCTALYLFEGVI